MAKVSNRNFAETWRSFSFLTLLVLLLALPSYAAAPPGGTLNPRNVPKYVTPLVIPPEMPPVAVNPDGTKSYDIEVIPHNQPILPPVANDGTPMNPTPVWTYAAVGNPATRNYPAFTIEVEKNKNAAVTWRNRLLDANGNPLPHLLPVDRSLHWANTELLPCMDGTTRTDCRPAMSNGLILQQPYTGPVPIITHVHGAHTGPESDGYPEAWYLPENTATTTPGFVTEGRLANSFGMANTLNGAAAFNYPNTQKSTTLWYHDHTLGMTRLNVYAGPAGFWLIREKDALGKDAETGLAATDAKGMIQSLPGPRPNTATNPIDHLGYREIPIVIQDRSFNHDPLTGATQLFYPNNRAFFEGLKQATQLKIPFVGDPLNPSDIAAIWNPEAFFNVMVVNGVSWPFMQVEPEKYRLRLLNGCNSRFLNLSMMALGANGKVIGEVPFYLIGNDQGLAPQVTRIITGEAINLTPGAPEPPFAPVPGEMKALLMGLAERADVIVDFSKVPVGTVAVRMLNTAPDAPFGGFPDIPADPGTTGQVMEFTLVPDNPATVDASTPPADLVLTNNDPIQNLVPAQNLALIEEESSFVCVSINPAGKVKVLPVAAPFNPLDPNNACALAGGFPFAPKEAVLGTVTTDAQGNASGTKQLWGDTIRTTPLKGSTETWEIWNFTVDAHPIHLHLVHFQVLERELFNPVLDAAGAPIPNMGTLAGTFQPLEAWENGAPKDTVIAYPGQVTRVQATFDIAGLYVWHCHIVEHEDNEMMVPYCVDDPGIDQTTQAPGNTAYCGPQAPAGI